jgi:LPS O-antigen subunit length determinant protein (WzzB/FepE family)
MMKLIIRPLNQLLLHSSRKIIGCVLLFCLLGMAQAPQKPASAQKEGSKAVITQILSDLKSAYEARNLQRVTELLDRDFEAALEFKASLENQFLNAKSLEITFILDSSLIEADKISARLHWLKKTIDRAGSFSKTRGSAQFVFKKSDDGIKLLYIRGDNPFF